MATYYVDDGGGKAVTAATKANPCQVTITGHGFSNGEKVIFHNVGGMTQLNFTNGSTGYTVTVVDANNITIGVDSSAYGTYTSGGTAHNGLSWGASFLSLSSLDDVFTFASGDTIYIGHDHVCGYTHSASRTITGPTSGAPCLIISATQGSSPPTYAASTTNQVDTDNFNLTLDGSFSFHGVRFANVDTFSAVADSDEKMHLRDCTIALRPNGIIQAGNVNTYNYFENLHVDLTADGTTARGQAVFTVLSTASTNEIRGLSFTNAGYRTGVIFSGGTWTVSGADFSGFTNATPCEWVTIGNPSQFNFHNCKAASTWTPKSSAGFTQEYSYLLVTNCEDVDSPAFVEYYDIRGDLGTRSDLYRSSGAEVEGDTCSWQVQTTTVASEVSPFYTPWMYALVETTGSKTFTVYVTHDTNPGTDADFTDAQMWLEVEVMGDAGGSPLATLATDHRTITTTAAAQTDDTSSTWNGTGPSFTYKQSLAVTATVNQAGLVRCRVAIAVPSLVDADYVLIDPLVTVS